MSGNKKSTVKKILNIFLNVILYAFLAICVFALIVGITAKRDAAGAAEFFGYKTYIVVSPSMEKCADTDVSGFKIKDIPVGSMVFVEAAPDIDEVGLEKADEWYAGLKVGDVLTFVTDDYGRQLTITHRIVGIEKRASGGYRIVLRGDNTGVNGDGTEISGAAKPMEQVIEDTSDVAGSLDYVLGKVTGKSFLLGWIAYSLQKPLGVVLIIIIPCAIIILLQVLRIINVVGEDKKKKAEEEQKKTSDEIEDLKRQLYELQKANAPPDEKAAADGKNDEKD